MRAILHTHTHFSYDSWISPSKLVEKAKEMQIDLLLITDHDTLCGSVAAARYAAEKGYEMQIPIAAEYLTDCGDVIVVNVPPDFRADFSAKELCRKAKELGAIVFLPHPFDHHDLNGIDFEYIDYVEVYNSRSSAANNSKALALCAEKGKLASYGGDVHLLRDLGRVVCTYERAEQPFTASFSPIEPLLSTPKKHKTYSQLIKAWKQRNLKLLLYNIKKLIQQR